MLQNLIVLGAVVAGVLVLFLWTGIRMIPNDRVAVVEKKFGGGSVKRGFIALSGEAGYQPQLLRGGFHWLMPFMYAVHKMPLVTIPQGKIGYVFARDGEPLEPEQA